MSHIETANTKLSLSVFIDIAQALEVRTDALVHDYTAGSVDCSMEEIIAILERCSAKESRIIAELVKAAKQSFDMYL